VREQKAVLRPSDVASLLGLTTGRIYQLIRAGDLPAVRRGRSIGIPRAAWEKWLAAQADRALAGTKSNAESQG
jgi:excisionase family DNA binding protein